MTTQSQQVHLVRRPDGFPREDDFALREVGLTDLRDGEVRVQNELLSVDPYMRGRMNDRASYVAPYELDEVMTGLSIGRVIESRDERLAPGDVVRHPWGWRDVAQGPGGTFERLEESAQVPVSAYLGPLGPTGVTAYVGLLHVARMKPGDIVFVSAAAGAVGSVAGQLAKLRGAELVVGSAGSDMKTHALVEEFGYDIAVNYRSGDLLESLRKAGVEEIDVYLDNVGGSHLEAALALLRDHGRVAASGAISLYNEQDSAPGPRYMENIIFRSLSIRGFLLRDFPGIAEEFLSEVAPLVANGSIRYRESIVEGIEAAVPAFLGLLRGENTGKMLVRVGHDV